MSTSPRARFALSVNLGATSFQSSLHFSSAAEALLAAAELNRLHRARVRVVSLASPTARTRQTAIEVSRTIAPPGGSSGGG